MVGLVVIWAHELQALAVSLVALAAAFVLATKELILCWSGAALRVGGKVYSVGDRIQIAGHRGVVLDHDIFATKLLEIGPGQASHLYTGRVMVFPNSLLFMNALVKENPGQEYGLYILVVPLRDNDDWRDAERHLLDAAKAECSSFMEEAGRHMKLLEQTTLLEAPSPEPRITIQLSEPGRIQLVLRFPAPDRGRSRIEQAILRRYLTAAASTN
jgi:small-conductance mechanosensitive channel